MFVKPKSAGVAWPTPLRNFILTLLWRTTFSCCSILLTILAYVHTFVLRFYDAIPTPPDCASVLPKMHPVWRPTDTILYSGNPCTRRKMISMATTYISNLHIFGEWVSYMITLSLAGLTTSKKATKSKSLNFVESNGHRKTNARGSFKS